jgi:hypothetical protein
MHDITYYYLYYFYYELVQLLQLNITSIKCFQATLRLWLFLISRSMSYAALCFIFSPHYKTTTSYHHSSPCNAPPYRLCQLQYYPYTKLSNLIIKKVYIVTSFILKSSSSSSSSIAWRLLI